MKDIYKKLYEAINTGIQKALVLDDEDDVSINYQHKKIVNNSNVISYYVDDILKDSNNKFINYKQIIKYYKETGYTYKVKNLNELKNIINKIKKFKNVSFEWISNIKDYVSIILEDNSEINFYEKIDKKPLFLKFANDDILGTENEILIYLYEDHCVSKEIYKWQTERIQIQPDEYLINMKKYGTYEKAIEIAKTDYSVYENCLRIYNIVSKEPEKYGEVPAIDQCLKLNINGYQGYLPSMRQLRILSDNIGMINYIFKYLNLNEIEDLNEDCWWSSSESTSSNSWYLSYGSTYDYNKVDNFRIFPLFAVKKN
ncbi:MAG: hypothetical protein [Wendovervirus sonii]|uniref:DUF1566 domain-containing protein n=1 Tax=phage Lak_Megaphage_Sonny TaxID=3109229 RepID=A0ABZ0Z477_9CAUD|nr:MAG: hypothetical protein [phage Lak_Megaphage_Sonny]